MAAVLCQDIPGIDRPTTPRNPTRGCVASRPSAHKAYTKRRFGHFGDTAAGGDCLGEFSEGWRVRDAHRVGGQATLAHKSSAAANGDDRHLHQNGGSEAAAQVESSRESRVSDHENDPVAVEPRHVESRPTPRPG